MTILQLQPGEVVPRGTPLPSGLIQWKTPQDRAAFLDVYCAERLECRIHAMVCHGDWGVRNERLQGIGRKVGKELADKLRGLVEDRIAELERRCVALDSDVDRATLLATISAAYTPEFARELRSVVWATIQRQKMADAQPELELAHEDDPF
ncbi:hypothetical protein [Hydrocarboniphaga sp.]|uniref:hypothetical protein n=1 Tax=Hydrocarboniphaga sp. TaxID=2033016 RepID=UPI003D13ABDA